MSPQQTKDRALTFGEWVADQGAEFGGSWEFIISFGVFLLLWIVLNAAALLRQPFDPYPHILLNLILSGFAALQAPIIMMSQNRQSAADRKMAVHDYEVNLKAEIEIMALHEKMDALRTDQLAALLEKQQQQLDLLTQLIARS